jgi:hypothetical protein
MCLSYVTTKKPLIAYEDITVYKLVKNGTSLVDNWKDIVFHGNDCIAVINGETVEGKISIEKIKYKDVYRKINGDDVLYICQNSFKGNPANDKLGYEYSWSLDECVTSIIVNGKEITTPGYNTIYQGSSVKIGNEYTSELILNDGEIDIGLHSYIKKPKFKGIIDIIAECVIPKGSKYFIGNFDEIEDSIASDRIRYVKILDGEIVKNFKGRNSEIRSAISSRQYYRRFLKKM